LILDGTIEPGSPLIQEEVASKLGVSRTPLREALRVLEWEGLIRSSNAGNTMEVVRFDVDEIVELYHIREVLDGLAARLAASVPINEGAANRIMLLAKALHDSIDPFNTGEFVLAHVKFHLSILEASKSQRLMQLEPLFRLSAQMLYPRLAANTDWRRDSVHEHDEIAEAILSADPELAEQRAREHIRRTLSYWKDRL
jgi:GntR family transcriptional regulator of vanillate catabolism